ncbi:sensor histidine kinase [Kitasatospora phosalacinea]|uniref:sensor histidine kinase n=1 Tax=Kitasatospora phosalacinea TaxID=2065 RepID=UPI000A7A8902|nr:histidine kinase [Kitasatospora phosalacinea]
MAVPVVAGLFTALALVQLFDHGPSALYVAVPSAVVTGVATLYWFMRRGAVWTRQRVERRAGERWVVVYSPREALEQDARGFWWTGHSYHRGHSVARGVQFVQWAVRDPQIRREALWLVANPAGLLVLVVPFLGLLAGGVGSVWAAGRQLHDRVGYLGEMGLGAIVGLFGVVLMAAGLWGLPLGMRRHEVWACQVLGGGPQPSRAQLTERVAQLTETRADAADAQAAELRRIERDLHDGAQARLVSIGLTLGAVEHLMATDQAAARELLAEARAASAKALQELRDLVRGIHPPVLAERGLPDAVRELALTAVVPTEVAVALPGRPEAALETAVYFSVSELLANVAKHARARQTWVDVLYRAGRLRVVVTDDGSGGARTEAGGGLQGIEKRLGTFDGTISLDSPVGGPTTITMELPCALSSPRTSTSSAKG